MKPAPFEYFAPTDLEEALDLLAQYGDEAKVLAGGQSLMPLMNMRLARPRVIIDINRLTPLAYISPHGDAGLSIGALARQRAVERSHLVQERQPLLGTAMPYVGHFQIRNRGTIGGSIVHADPAAEIPALCVALEAAFVLTGATAQRVIKAEDFFVTYLTTAIEPVELFTEVRVPAAMRGWGWGIDEICRREGDFALVGAVALLQIDAEDVCQGVRLVMFGVGGTPVRARQAEELLRGRRVDAAALQEVARLVAQEMQPDADIHASAQYRQEVAGVIARRTLTMALRRAKEGSVA